MDVDGPIVIAYDGSAAARAAFTLAGLHVRPDRDVVVITVNQPVESLPWVGTAGVVIPDGLDEQVRASSEGLAREGAELAAKAGFEATGIVSEVSETVWNTIVEVAAERDASVILMGTHGRSGVSGALLGSVATAVMHHAGRPVAVVPASYAEALQSG